MTRKELQNIAFNEITNEFYSPNSIYMGEYPTGSGKGKILLDSADEIVSKSNKSVIISTSNNALVSSLVNEARKHKIKAKVKVIIGANNYVDLDSITNPSFISESGILLEKVEKWIDNKQNNHHLVSSFIDDFGISPEYSSLIAYNRDTENQEAKEENSLIRKIKDFSESPCICITNHTFLIVAYRFISKKSFQETEEQKEFQSIPLFLDEAHTLFDSASMIFSNKFSVFALTSSLRKLIYTDNENISKKNIQILTKALHQEQEFLKSFAEYEDENDNIFIEKFKNIKNSSINKDLLKAILIISKKSKSASQKKQINIAHRELAEMYLIGYVSDNQINVQLSPSRLYPSFVVNSENPSKELRNKLFANTKGFIVGLSGTLTISDSSSYENNKWSLNRIGLFPFKDDSSYALDYYQKQWNSKLYNLYFTVKEQIFSKNQAQYYVFNEKKYRFPRLKDLNNSQVIQAEQDWIDNISKAVMYSLQGNTLVLMSSFSNCKALATILKNSSDVTKEYEIFYSNQNETMKETQARYENAINVLNKKAILIGNLSFYVGINLPEHLLNTLIIGKLPFEPNNKMFSRYKFVGDSSIFNNFAKAILTFRQGLGRGLRSERDKVNIVVLDPRIQEKKYKIFLYFLQKMSMEMGK